MAQSVEAATTVTLCFADSQRLTDAVNEVCAKRHLGIEVDCPDTYTESQKVSRIIDTIIRTFSLGTKPRLESVGASMQMQTVSQCP